MLNLLLLLLPWPARRRALQCLWGYRLHPTSRIGFSLVMSEQLFMEQHSRIGHLTVCKGLELLSLAASASIGNLNWITGFPRARMTVPHFGHCRSRSPRLCVGEHSAITNRHLIDCTDAVTIGHHSTVAGFRSQILTHSIDLAASRQGCQPVRVGDYCFVGTAAVLLPGSQLPSYSVLGAMSLLNKQYRDTHWLYSGVPARPTKALSGEILYFEREAGAVA
jgi:acetyltransferase-like isoleucine patch superfamily enzyme